MFLNKAWESGALKYSKQDKFEVHKHYFQLLHGTVFEHYTLEYKFLHVFLEKTDLKTSKSLNIGILED